MADIKKFIFLDANGNAVEQSEHVSIEVDAATTARGVVNKDQMDAAVAAEAQARQAADEAEAAARGAAIAALAAGVAADRNAAVDAINLSLLEESQARSIADNALTGRINGLQDDLTTEIQNRGAAELSLSNRINSLTNDFVTGLNAEIARATAEEARIEGLVTAETAARTLADGQLGDAITAEAQARGASDTALGLRIDGVSADLATEISNRQTAVNNEAAERAAQDALLSGRIDAEVTRATAAEGSLRSDLTAETSRATAAEGSLRSDLNAEIQARQNADTALQGDIDAEESLRASEITRVEGLITAEQAARIAKDALLDGRIDTEIADRTAADATEKARAEAAESVLRAGLAQELLDRAAGDLTEKNRAEAAEAVLRADLLQEISDRQAAVTSEQNRATDAEGVLTSNLSNEIARATGEEQRIEAKFDAAILTEQTARANADTSLRNDLSAETARATLAESGLRSDLTTEVNRATLRENNIESALNAEITRATAEEIAVENRAKAYADARVQGLKVKDSVQFGVARYQPIYHSVGGLKFKAAVNGEFIVDGPTGMYPQYNQLMNAFTLWRHSAAAVAAGLDEFRIGNMAQTGTDGVEYTPVEEPVRLVMKDMTDSANLVSWLQDRFGPDYSKEVHAGSRVAVLNNNLGSTYGNSLTEMSVLESGTFAEKTDKDLGIFQMNEAGAFVRAPDFAAGMNVAGAYFLVETNVPGATNGWDSSNNAAYVQLGQTIAYANSGITVGQGWDASQPDNGESTVIVGSDSLTFKLFSRAQDLEFEFSSIKKSDFYPNRYGVRTDRARSVAAYGSGVGVDINSYSVGLAPPNTVHLAHVKYDFSPTSDNSTGLGLVGPLVNGKGSKADDFHGHNVITKTFYKADDGTGYANINAGIQNTFGPGMAVRIDATTGLPVAATWDSSEVVGAYYNFQPGTSGTEVIDPVSGGFIGGAAEIYVAVSGVSQCGFQSPALANFAVNEVFYVGSAPFNFVKFSDIPSGKWAIPFGKKVGDFEFVLLDRPATLKA